MYYSYFISSDIEQLLIQILIIILSLLLLSYVLICDEVVSIAFSGTYRCLICVLLLNRLKKKRRWISKSVEIELIHNCILQSQRLRNKISFSEDNPGCATAHTHTQTHTTHAHTNAHIYTHTTCMHTHIYTHALFLVNIACSFLWSMAVLTTSLDGLTIVLVSGILSLFMTDKEKT